MIEPNPDPNDVLWPFVCIDHGLKFDELGAYHHLRNEHPELHDRLQNVTIRPADGVIETTAVEVEPDG